MLLIEKLLPVGPERAAHKAKRTVVGFLVALVAFAPLWSVTPGLRPIAAGAASTSGTQAQITAIEAQILAGAGDIHRLTLVYAQANLNATNLAQEVASDRIQVSALQGRLGSAEAALRQEALLSYVGGASPSPPGATAATGGVADPSIRAEYIQVAAGDVTNAADRYRLEQRQLATAEALATQQEAQARQALGAVAQARQDALAQAASEQGHLSQLQTQLVAAEAAAAAQAAQALQAAKAAQAAQSAHSAQVAQAAQAQAGRAAEAARQIALPAAPAATPGQGGPVNGGLVTVVRGIVNPTPAQPAPSSVSSSGGVWLELRQCESGDNYQANTGNGFYGAYQFTQATWSGLGYPGRPDQEPPAMQDAAAQRLQASSGWGQWPACSAALGLH
ncbi:MAG: transglycosylase family protein [Acidimicrobiales bacterium]